MFLSPIQVAKTESQNSIESTTSSVESLDLIRKRVVSDFEFGETLGEGSYSTVLLAKDKLKDRYYAVKVLEKKHIIKENKVKYVSIEKDVLNKLSSPYIIRLYYTFQDQSSLYFVLEYCPNGDLLALLKKNGRLDREAAKFYSLEIALGLEHIHSQNILHRDLKPENILLDKKFHVKITDFGSACILDSPNSQSNPSESLRPRTERKGSFVGTAEYCSPELLNERAATKSSDVWALGVILYQLLVGVPPIQGSNDYQIFQRIIKLEYTIPPELDETSSSLITSILKLEPAERPPLEIIIQDPFFSGLSLSTIRSRHPPKLLYIAPLKLPGPNTDSLYMNPDEYFKAKNMNSTPLQCLESTESLESPSNLTTDTWLPDLSNSDVEPESILMSAIVKKRSVGEPRRRGILLNKKHFYIYELKTSRISSSYPLGDIHVELIDSSRFSVKPNNTDRFVIEGLHGELDASDWVTSIQSRKPKLG